MTRRRVFRQSHWPRVLFSIIIVLATVRASSADNVENILSQADQWIITDTSRILSYIDSCNGVTDSALRSSPYWDSTYRALSFLMGIDYVSAPQIDNTGRIYFLMRLTGPIEHLFYVDSSGGWPHQITPNSWADEGYSIYYYEAHPSGDFVLVGAMKHGSEKHDIFMFNRDGTFRPLLVNPRIEYSNVVFKNRDQFLLMVSDDTSRVLSRYTISSGVLEPLYKEKEWIDIYDYRNGLILCQRWFSFSESQVILFDEQDMAPKNLTGKGYFESSALTRDGRVITMTKALSGSDEFNKIALLDTRKPGKFKPLYDPKMEMDGLRFVKQLGTCLVMLNRAGYSQVIAVDLNGDKIRLPSLETGIAEDIRANDYGEFVFSFSSPSLPPAIFRAELGISSLARVASTSTFGFDFSGIDVRTIRFPAKDGMLIPALLYLPRGLTRDGTAPAIVEFHGGPPGQSRPYFQRNVAFGLSQGFVMMFPNVRGSTGYGPAWEAADNLAGRYQALDDCIAALDYLVVAGYSSPPRIGIWGASYGGYVVNYLSTTAPEKFACAVSEVGESDMDYDNTHGDVTFLQGWEREYGLIGSKLTHDLSPIFKAENVERPMLITAGFNDPRVFPGDPRRWGYLLAGLGKDVLYYEETATGHWGTTRLQDIDSYTRAYVFFLEHLK